MTEPPDMIATHMNANKTANDCNRRKTAEQKLDKLELDTIEPVARLHRVFITCRYVNQRQSVTTEQQRNVQYTEILSDS